MGLNLQEKIHLCRDKGFFNSEQTRNITKIEDDGLNVVLDIVDKYVIKRVKNKNQLEISKCLAVISEGNKVIIDSMDQIYKRSSNNNLFNFLSHQFAKLFNDEYKLAEKIKSAYESLK